jgi:hypothetical protein
MAVFVAPTRGRPAALLAIITLLSCSCILHRQGLVAARQEPSHDGWSGPATPALEEPVLPAITAVLQPVPFTKSAGPARPLHQDSTTDATIKSLSDATAGAISASLQRMESRAALKSPVGVVRRSMLAAKAAAAVTHRSSGARGSFVGPAPAMNTPINDAD